MADDAALDAIRACMKNVQSPNLGDQVYKDQCCFTFDNVFSKNGIYTSLKSPYLSYGKDQLKKAISDLGGGNYLFLHQQFQKVAKKPTEEKGEAEPTKLAIGVEGGFDGNDAAYDTIENFAVVVIGDSGEEVARLAYQKEGGDDVLPMLVGQAVKEVINRVSSDLKNESNMWEKEEAQVSKYAESLVQMPVGDMKISPNPADWKCGKSGDTNNLWLNLSDGYIGGGRKQWDGSGGSNGALDHYKEEKEKGNEFPLVVKLGTITPHGADVYSYAPDEDNEVKDPKLAEHLAHWGIDIMKLEKTDKTMEELELEQNKNWTSRITESDAVLKEVDGPGLKGLINLGNSCYMNSTLQLLMSVRPLVERYLDADLSYRYKVAANDRVRNISFQLSKLTNALMGDRYVGKEPIGATDLRPNIFKSAVAQSHSEFSTGRQQDAEEYFLYLLDQLTRSERTAFDGQAATANQFTFQVETRLQCREEGSVKYRQSPETMLGLEVSQDDLVREPSEKKLKVNPEDEVPPTIAFESCLAKYFASSTIADFKNPSLGRVTGAEKVNKLASMPPYLAVQLRRYYVDEKWQPQKLDCLIPMPQELDLEAYRGGKGLQAGEKEMAEAAEAPAAAAEGPVEPDASLVQQLVAMGFGENGCKRACIAVKNADVETAANWVFAHMEDADFNDPPEVAAPAAPAAAGADEANPESVMMLTSMGFAEEQVKKVLKICDGNAERAGDWFFSHMDNLDADIEAALGGGQSGGSGSAPAAAVVNDGPGKYELVAFLSHQGKSTGCGHYVCHVKKPEHGWVLFNDEKVAVSEKTPFDLGYMYLYKRKDVSGYA